MKTNKFLKISLLILSFALVLGAAFAMSISAETEEPTPKLEIVSKNVFYTDQFQLMFAVTAENITSDFITLNVYAADPATGAEIVKPFNLNKDEITKGDVSGLKDADGTPIDAYLFTVDGVGATEMLKEIYVQAVIGEGDSAVESEVKKYSVAEYLYERLAGKKTITDEQKAFYLSIIDFGTNAQGVFGEEGDILLSDYSYLYVDDVAKGIVPVGTFINPYVGAAGADWNVTSTLASGKATTAVQESGFVIPDAIKTEAVVIEESKVAFTDGTDTLNTLPTGDTLYTVSGKGVRSESAIKIGDTRFGASADTAYYRYLADPYRGVVAMFDVSYRSNRIMQFNPTATLPEGTTATAYECSFDMKVEFDGTQTVGEEINTRLAFYGEDASTPNNLNDKRLSQKYINYYWKGNGKYQINIGNTTLDMNVETEDQWIHIRQVIYADDLSTAYIYVNGAETHTTTVTLSGVTSFSDITCAGVFCYGHTSGDRLEKIYFDNIFVGLTTAVKPAAQ